ncbi:Serine/threonine-protein kinase ATG1a (Autophagy-related protein 1a) (AtAPG1a), partial [Durusdinium trenchii]
VAVKAIARSKLTDKLRDNLRKEISILEGLHHRNIVELLETHESNRHIYLVMEFCAGGDLHKFLRRAGPLGPEQAQGLVRQLAEGMRFLWERSLVHRDLKPQNLLLTEASAGAVLKIADFGFATHLGAAAMAETMCGSPLYMAPEILDGKSYDAKADLWSVGTILHEMLFGKPPFLGGNPRELLKNILRRGYRFPPKARATAPAGCASFLEGLLRANPVERMSFEDFFQQEFIRSAAPGTDGTKLNLDDVQVSSDSSLPEEDFGDSGSEPDDIGAPKPERPLAPEASAQNKDDAWELIASSDGHSADAKAAEHAGNKPGRSKPPKTSPVGQGPRHSRQSTAAHVVRYAGELFKRVEVLAKLLEDVRFRELGEEMPNGNEAARVVDLGELGDPSFVLMALLVKCLKILRGAQVAIDEAELPEDSNLRQAAKLTRDDIINMLAHLGELVHGVRAGLRHREGTSDTQPTAERLLLELAAQLGRAGVAKIEIGDMQGKANLLAAASSLFELLCADPGLDEAEREQIKQLNAVCLIHSM